MDKQKLQKSRKLGKPKESNWFEFINDDSDKLVIPLGSPFQADIPEWTSPSRRQSSVGDATWLGTEVWPNRRRGQSSKNGEIGKGRPESCQCASPGSVECVKRHVADKKAQLRRNLGTAFKKWRFDEMGEDVSKWWNVEEEKKFDSVVRMYPSSDKESFLQLALETFPYRSRQDIVKYYFNVYVLRRMSAQTRAGYVIADSTDDDDDDVPAEPPRVKTPPKRSKPENDALSNSKDVQSKYLKVPRR